MVEMCPEHKREFEQYQPAADEQAWCGTWYRCPDCNRTILVMSEALRAEYEIEFQRIETEYHALKTAKQRARLLKKIAPWFAARLATHAQ